MPNKVINARIKQKRDTDSNWQSKNPVLLNGEIILVDMSDGELRSKIGDGKSTYQSLPFSDEPLRNLIDDIDAKADSVKDLVGDTSVAQQISNSVEQINTALSGKSDSTHTHPVDSALSSTSTNPVQNKVVFEVTKALIDGLGEKSVADQISEAVANKSDIDHTHTAIDVGALPYVYDGASDLDLDELIKSGEHYRVYRISGSTLGTPYKYGVSSYGYGIVLSVASGPNYACQFAFISGANCIYERRFANGTIGDWCEVYHTGNVPTLSELGVTASVGELNYCDGVTSNIQTQLDAKAPSSHNHAASNITSGILPIARGGTGSGSGLEGAPNNAIIKRLYTEDADGNVTNNQLYYTPTKSGAFYATAENGAATFGTLPIEQGGTGAVDNINAMKNLAIREINTVPAEDTPSAWGALGLCQIYYNNNSTVINKPSTYGTLINIPSSYVVHQIFFRQAYGYVWVRSGSSTGWSGTSSVSGADAWRRVYDSSCTIPVANGGTGKTTSLEAANNLKVFSLSEGAQIANGTDLDTITTVGNYRCTNSTDLASLTNSPTSSALFSMKVGHLPNNPEYLYQEITTFYNGRHYYRKKSGADAAWSDWYADYNGSSAIPVSGGGTGAKTAPAARENLGFTYGSSEPTGTPETGEGSVYFRTGGDAVVEVGTSGIWTYRKWASGIAECWGNYVCSSVLCNKSWGQDYYSESYTIDDYPFTFTSLPSVTIGIAKTTNSWLSTLLYGGSGASNSSSGKVSFLRPTENSSVFDATVSVQAIGRWK